MEYAALQGTYTQPIIMSQILKHQQNTSCIFPSAILVEKQNNLSI